MSARRLLGRLGAVALRAGRRVVDIFPFSPLGLFVAGAAAAALKWFAYGQLDLVLLVVGYVGLGLPILSMIFVVVGALWVRTRAGAPRHPEPLRAETMRRVATGLVVPSLVWLPLARVRWGWQSPRSFRAQVLPERRFTRLLEEVVLHDRGEIRGVERRFVIEDVLGLARIAIRKRDPVAIDVLPNVGGLRQMPVLVSLAGGDELPHPMGIDDGDRVELRRYVPGDPARFIHWKVFSRTRKLMVRVPERALTRARRTVAYLVAGEDDDATAAAARVAIETDALGGEWTFGADGSTEDARRVDDAVRLVVRSSAARAHGGAGLRAFLARAERNGPASAVVFAPPRPGAWLEPVLAAARLRRHRMRVVIGTDGVVARAQLPLWRRLLASSAEPEGTPADALDRVVRALASARADVVLFDRTTGRRLGEAHREAMRSLAAEPRSTKRAQKAKVA